MRPVTGERELRGVAVYPDIVIGKAHLIDRSRVKILYQCFVNGKELDREVERFEEAVHAVEDQFVSLKNKMPDKVKDQSFILDSHLMILKDGMLYDSTVKAILEEKINAEWALKKSLEEIREVFEQIDDEYISKHMKVEPMEMMIRLSEILDSYDLDVWIWQPNMGKPLDPSHPSYPLQPPWDPSMGPDEHYVTEEGIQKELAEREEIFSKLKRIDHILVPGDNMGRYKNRDFRFFGFFYISAERPANHRNISQDGDFIN